MAAYRGALFAAGHFDTVDGTVVNHIARWDGLTWQSLGEGIGTTSYGGVYDLAVHAGHLWVGGAFNYAGGHPAQNLCTWYELPLSVYLQDMQASRDHGSVCVSWTVSGEGGDFLLERINGNGTRVEVARKPATGHHHEVLDVTAPTTACRYVLHLCADDGTETVLAEVLAPATIPSALNLTSLAPNPFNPATRLAFTLPYPGIVKVTVHDLQGRTIATLLDEALSVGEHEVVWHGMDDDGHAVASGAYLVRVYAGDQHRTVKAVLVR